MMIFQLGDSRRAVGHDRAMAREGILETEAGSRIQAPQIMAQRIVHAYPHCDIRGDITQDVIATEQRPMALNQETHVPGCMSNGLETAKRVARLVKHISIPDNRVSEVAFGPVDPAGMPVHGDA